MRLISNRTQHKKGQWTQVNKIFSNWTTGSEEDEEEKQQDYRCRRFGTIPVSMVNVSGLNIQIKRRKLTGWI